MIALRTEDIRKNALHRFVRLGVVGGWDYHLPRLPVPCEENPYLGLGYRDHEKRLGVRQNARGLK
jgi:hypothetical protein